MSASIPIVTVEPLPVVLAFNLDVNVPPVYYAAVLYSDTPK